MAIMIAYSERDGDIFTASFREVAYAAWQAITGGGLAALTDLVNPAIRESEKYLLEYTRVEMVIYGWSNPITGIDYSKDVANWINSQWQAGHILNSEGNPVTPWPEYADRIAWGGGDQVTLRWVKTGLGAPFLILWLAVAIVIIGAIAAILYTKLMSPWRMYKQEERKEEQLSWWDKLSITEKAAVIAGGTVAAMFLLWYLAERSIAQAGAPQIVVTSGG